MIERETQTYLKNPYVFNTMGTNINQINYHHKNQYSQQKVNNYLGDSPKKVEQNYQSLSLNNSIHHLPNETKVSHARNYKLLLSQVNLSEELKKQKQRENYRKELELQIQADKDRKKKQKQKIQKQEAERQRKFYAQIQIKAKEQPKKNKEQPSYFILRSGQKNRKRRQLTDKDIDDSRMGQQKQKQKQKQKAKETPFEQVMPKIIKRGGYHNQSALDRNIVYNNNSSSKEQNTTFLQKQKFENKVPYSLGPPLRVNEKLQRQQRELEILRQRNYEQQRINSIIKLQDKMLRKLDHFKEQIKKINKNLDLEKEVNQIRNILKSKSVKLESFSVRNDQYFQNFNQFYRFPKIQGKSQMNEQHRPHRSRVEENTDSKVQQNMMSPNQKPGKNHKILTEENPQEEQQNQNKRVNLQSVRRKRQIKHLNRKNDKNFIQEQETNQQNQHIKIPVVFQ